MITIWPEGQEKTALVGQGAGKFCTEEERVISDLSTKSQEKPEHVAPASSFLLFGLSALQKDGLTGGIRGYFWAFISDTRALMSSGFNLSL